MSKQTYGSVNNMLMANMTGMPKPEVGMGATLLSWTDRHAATIIEVSADGRTIRLQQDNARRTDSLGLTDSGQEYEYTPNPQGPITIAKLTQYGWRQVRDMKARGKKSDCGVVIGRREEYYDPTF